MLRFYTFKHIHLYILPAKSQSIFEKENKDNSAPRENGKIVIKHTARVFPTPTRESQTPQEEEVCYVDRLK